MGNHGKISYNEQAGQARQRMQDAGIDLASYDQRVIHEPGFLEQLVRLCKPNVYSEIPAELKKHRVDVLVWQILGIPTWNRAKHSEEFLRFASDAGIRELLSVLSERQLSIVLTRHGLATGRIKDMTETAEMHHISVGSARNHEQEAQVKMRKQAHRLLDPDFNFRVESLYLSQRPYGCIKRRTVDTVAGLSKFSAEQLLRIPSFGEKSLNEVRYRLAQRGLTLYGERSVPEQIVLEFSGIFGD